ncbi:MAG TPA: DUF4395 domain-containing protein [Candidatus Lumbricidophila sp.]|nr:DUF4395 domain-containing protein [Candidatus Lumbricidophila sp.]
MSTPNAHTGIDPRGPRVTAGITAALLLVVVLLGLVGETWTTVSAFGLEAVLMCIFAWAALAGVARHPFGGIFRKFIRPRLAPPRELEDPRPPTFAQAVGFVVTAIGFVLGAIGVSIAVPITAAIAFIAAFLNAVFGFCLGCWMYLQLVKLRVIRA